MACDICRMPLLGVGMRDLAVRCRLWRKSGPPPARSDLAQSVDRVVVHIEQRRRMQRFAGASGPGELTTVSLEMFAPR